MKDVVPTFTLTKSARDLVARLRKAAIKYPANKEKLSRLYAETAVTLAKEGIEKQLFGHSPLSIDWLRKKAQRGLDSRTLIATKRFLDSIEVKRSAGGSYGVVADMPLFKFIEYGTRSQPARPFVRPVMEKLRGSMNAKRVEEVVNDLLGR